MQNKEIHTRGGQKRPHQPKVSGKFLLLDTRLLNSPDLFRLRETMGMEGWGMALFVLNYLLEHGEWGRAPLHAVTDLARMCHKNKRTMMALLTDYPTLFEIEAGGKVFNSPYLRQCLGGEKIKINQKSCGLGTLTNEPSDNQALSLHRIKDERIKKKNDEEKETTAADAADAVAKKAEKGAKQPAASGTKEAKMVGRSVASGAKQRVTSAAQASPATNALPHRPTKVAPLAPAKATEESAQHVEQATASLTDSAVKAANVSAKATEESAQHVGQATTSPANSAAKAANAPEKAMGENARHVEQATASPTDSAAKAANAPAKATGENAQHVEQATTSPTNSATKARAKAMGESARHVEQATASPTDSAAKAANASAKATEGGNKRMEQATASPTNSAAKAANTPAKAAEGGSKHAGQVAKQPGFRLETVFTDLAQAARKLPDDERQPLRTTWEILAQLYADSLYWQSLERLVGLEVYSQERWKHLALRWFFTYCVTQAKPIAALNDAKSYLNHLLQPGRNTRQAFEHYAQTQYEADCRAWQHYRQWCIDNHHSIP